MIVGVGYPGATAIGDTVDLRARDLTPTNASPFATSGGGDAFAASETQLAADVFFGIGELETDEGRRQEGRNLPDGHAAKPPPIHLDMVDDLRRFVAQVGSRHQPKLSVQSIEIADEFHATVPGIVLNRALRNFFSS